MEYGAIIDTLAKMGPAQLEQTEAGAGAGPGRGGSTRDGHL